MTAGVSLVSTSTQKANQTKLAGWARLRYASAVTAKICSMANTISAIGSGLCHLTNSSKLIGIDTIGNTNDKP